MVEHAAVNRVVVGSSPTSGANSIQIRTYFTDFVTIWYQVTCENRDVSQIPFSPYFGIEHPLSFRFFVLFWVKAFNRNFTHQEANQLLLSSAGNSGRRSTFSR